MKALALPDLLGNVSAQSGQPLTVNSDAFTRLQAAHGVAASILRSAFNAFLTGLTRFDFNPGPKEIPDADHSLPNPKRRPKRAPMATHCRSTPSNDARMVKIGALIVLPVIVASAGTQVMGEALKELRIGQDFCYAANGAVPNSALFVDVSFTDDMSEAQDRDLTRALTAAYETHPADGGFLSPPARTRRSARCRSPCSLSGVQVGALATFTESAVPLEVRAL